MKKPRPNSPKTIDGTPARLATALRVTVASNADRNRTNNFRFALLSACRRNRCHASFTPSAGVYSWR
jgi:hypothetical protein